MKAPKGVPRDEWLLAQALPRFRASTYTREHDVATAVCGFEYRPHGRHDEYERRNRAGAAAYSGADDLIFEPVGVPSWGDYGNPDAYAAGAALAMALEGGHE